MKPSLVLCAAALAAAVAGAALAGITTDPPVGSQAKEFKAVDVLNMRPAKNPLHALKGRVVLFIAFETRGNARCEEAVPDINGLHDKYGPQGMTVLAFTEQERKSVEPWIEAKGARFAWALIDTPTAEQFKRDWPYPGQPWAFLVDATGKIVWQENPRNMQNPNVLKPGTLDPLLAAATQAPWLPKALAAQQPLLDDGRWAEAKKAFDAIAAEGKLDKADLAWAKGVSAWIVRRHDAYMTDADALVQRGWWWDAWDMMNEFPRKFEGMDGADKAKAKAEEIRKIADPAAAKDLQHGDDVAKARDLARAGKAQNARLILTRILKEAKGTRHAERAQDILETLPPK